MPKSLICFRQLLHLAIAALVLVATDPAAAASSEDDAIIDYVIALEPYRQHRDQPDAPVPSRQDIKNALKGELVVKKGNHGEDGLHYVWAARIMDVSPVNYWLTIIDRRHYSQMSDNIVESFISEELDGRFFTYNVLEAPLVSTRHQVLDARVNVELFENSGGRLWEHYWNLAPDLETKLAEALAMNQLQTYTTEDLEDAVVIEHNNGAWMVIPLPDGRTWAETITVNDPGGRIPEFILRRVSETATGRTFDDYLAWARNRVPQLITESDSTVLSPTAQFMTHAAIAVDYAEPPTSPPAPR